MSDMIGRELQFLAASFAWGLLLMALYDVIRILRKIIPHPFLLTAAQDLAYWMVGGLLVFRMIYAKNDGIIRGYFVVALLAGMSLYYAVVGEKVVRLVWGAWDKAWSRAKGAFAWLTRPVRAAFHYFGKIIKIFKNNLKSMKKTVTIALKKH